MNSTVTTLPRGGTEDRATVIALHPMVLRQDADSPYSHYLGEPHEVVAMAKAGFEGASPGYRDGVVTVPVPPEGFYSGVIQLTENQRLTGSFKRRREGEDPRKEVLVLGGSKLPAAQVDIVLYRSDVLAEGGDNTLEPSKDNWEVVSINASPVEGDMPIAPMTLMHNHFGSDGGTDTQMSDTEFVAALRVGFRFWADKAMAE